VRIKRIPILPAFVVVVIGFALMAASIVAALHLTLLYLPSALAGLFFVIDAFGYERPVDWYGLPVPLPKSGLDRRFKRVERQLVLVRRARDETSESDPHREYLKMQIDQLVAVRQAIEREQANRSNAKLMRETDKIVKRELS
jgi:hypothetical protein